MAKAKRVHSTPRKTAPKIKANPRDRHHGEAFRELETPIREVWCMAQIAADAAMDISPGENNEIVHFAIRKLLEMVRDLHAEYRVGWLAGKAVQP